MRIRATLVAGFAAAFLALAGLPSAVSASSPPPLEAYGQLPTIEDVSLSPSGQRIALVVRDDKGTKVYAREIGGPILMAAPINDGFVDDVHWAGENVVLVRLSNIVKEGLYAWVESDWVASDEFALDLATHKVTQILKDVPGVRAEVGRFLGARNLESRWYGYYGLSGCGAEWSNCEGALFKVDLENGLPFVLSHASGYPQWVVNTKGEVTGQLVYDDRNSHWTLASTANGSVLSHGTAGFDGIALWGSGRTDDTAAFVTRADDGLQTLFEVSLQGGGPAREISKGQEVLGSWTDPVDGHLAGYAWADDTWHDVMFDTLAQKRLDAARAAFPNYFVRLVSASRDFGRIIAFTDGGDDSGTYWLVDINSGKATILGSAYPLVPPAETAPVSVFRYKAADGLPLEGVLTLPPGRDPKNLPLVVLAHGGPEERARPEFDWLAQAFAARGYAVLAPNFRGSGGFGESFRDAGFDQWGRKMQTDISDGVDALAAAGVVDSRRACIMGIDYGGYAAVAGVTLQHGRYRCAVSFWGVFDLSDLFARHSEGDSRLSMKYWADFIGVGKGDANLDALSPVKQAAAADAPVLLVSTQPDRWRLIDQSPAMEQALRKAGKTVDLTRIDSNDSRLRSALVRTELLRAAVPFVEKYDPGP